jgi:AraC-like DNA-binding protein
MLFVPLPFVVSFILLLLLARMISEGGTQALIRPFFILTGSYAFLSAVIGLRWGYEMKALLPVMLILATALPSLAWVAFSRLTSSRHPNRHAMIHILPTALIAAQLVWWPFLVDWFLAAVSLGYGAALLALAARGYDALDKVPLENTTLVHRSLIATGIMLISSAILDGLISMDFTMTGGKYAASYVTLANLTGLLILGAAAATAGSNPTPDEQDEGEAPTTAQPRAEDYEIAAKIAAITIEKQLFRDPELTLNRLARKALVPARQISTAINRTRKQSVSQFMNGHRIAEACRLLAETDHSITTIMFESGFQTKSNFNREFLRQTGTNPVDWRQKNSRGFEDN